MKPNNTIYKLIPIVLSAVLISVYVQQPMRIQFTVDVELASICSDASSPYAERVRLIHHLPSNLASEQLEALSDLKFNGLKNELVSVLLRQYEGLTELAELLVRMSRAPDTDATRRDYCVQFLGKCYPRINDAKSRETMAEALWEALRIQRKDRTAGSAARQLMTLGRTFPEFPLEKVAAAALEALLAPASSNETKIVLQVYGTLGKRGDASDIPLLERLAGSTDTRVARPSSAALAKIRK